MNAPFAPWWVNLRCKIGLHQWIEGRGYIPIGRDVAAYYEGKRCVWCLKCKSAPDIVEWHVPSAGTKS